MAYMMDESSGLTPLGAKIAAQLIASNPDHMAYMVDVIRKCPGCGRPASWEVFNNRNASQGKFCYRCGKKKVAELNAAETAKEAQTK
jgi:hypothetical protein